MNTSKATISAWFDEAKERGATHMLVVCDLFDYEGFPVLVLPGQDARAVYHREANANVQCVMEVYDLSLDKESQLSERRAFHLPA